MLAIRLNKSLCRKLKPVAALLLVAAALTGCGDSEAQSPNDTGKAKVAAAFYPLEWVASRVSGEAATVTSITPQGAEPHGFTLDAKALRNLKDADLVLYIGDGFQPQVEKAIDSLPATTKKIDALKIRGMDLLAPLEAGDHDHEEAEAEHKDASDPHVWLDPERMKLIAAEMARVLKEIAADKASTFDEGLQATTNDLNNLNGDIRAKLANCKTRTVVTSHAAFQYFTRRYDLNQLAIAGVNPDAEPDAKTLQRIAHDAKSANATTIYFEDALPAKLADAVAREVGARTDLLSTLEFDPSKEDSKADYISVMSDNVNRLANGLGCNT